MKIKFTFFALLCPCDLIGFIFSLKSKTNYFWAAPMFIKRTDLKLHFHSNMYNSYFVWKKYFCKINSYTFQKYHLYYMSMLNIRLLTNQDAIFIKLRFYNFESN